MPHPWLAALRTLPGIPHDSRFSPVDVLVVLLVVTTAPVGAMDSDAGTRPSIEAVYPDPVTADDVGEFVVLAFPEQTNVSGWTLTDGKTTARLPNTTIHGRAAFSVDPDVARNATDLPVYRLGGRLQLANDGDALELRDGRGVVDAIEYGRAPSGERWSRADGGTWTPLGRTDRSPARFGPTTVRAFVLPDAPGVPLAAFESAEERILLGGYTFTSREVSQELRRAARRGVAVRILVEDAPVGGISRRQASILDSLVEEGVDVQVLGGPRARYTYHHAKYAIVDDRALVTTENWKPSGIGGGSSRGWGVVVDDPAVAAELAEVFEADADWRDTIPWESFREDRTFQPPDAANGTYPTRFEAEDLQAESVSVVVAPDNAEDETVDLLRSAEESIAIEQVTIGDRRQPFVQAAVAAARRGVTVRVLLGDAWYVREDNREIVDWLNARADAEDLPLSARLIDPRSRFEKLHAKGVIVDERHVVVGSMNWNNHSARENREVMVVLEGEDVGGYYTAVFESDWERGSESDAYPVGMGVAVVVGLVSAWLLAGREVHFE